MPQGLEIAFTCVDNKKLVTKVAGQEVGRHGWLNVIMPWVLLPPYTCTRHHPSPLMLL